MGNTVRLEEIHSMTVDEFLATGQIAFGSAWDLGAKIAGGTCCCGRQLGIEAAR